MSKPVSLRLIAQAIPKLSRHELVCLTERLIDHLDAVDGDSDLEPEEDRCPAGDDGLGPFYYWGTHHGSRWEDHEY